MGSCYSCKASSGSYPYTTVPMATVTHEDTPRVPRPTPYTRASGVPVPGGGGGGLKRCIPPPTKYRTGQLIEKYETQTFQSTDNVSSNTKPTNTTTEGTRYLNSSTESVQYHREPNDNVAEDSNINNNVYLESTPYSNASRHHPSDAPGVKRGISQAIPVASSYQEKPLSQVSRSCPDNIDHGQLQYGTSRIPAKLTAQVSGLPKPQTAYLSGKSSFQFCEDQASKEKTYVKKEQGSNRISPDKDSCSDKSSHESFTVEYDSGVGQSLSDQLTKSEDTETLKDINMFESHESSPCAQDLQSAESTDKCPNNNLSSNKNISDSFRSKLKKVSNLPERTVNGDRNQIQHQDNKNKTYSQSSYADYRGILSYRRISPLKHFSEPAVYRKVNEKKDTPSKAPPGSPKPNIVRAIITTKGKKSTEALPVKKENVIVSPRKCISGEKTDSSPTSDEKGDSPSREEGFLSPTSDVESRGFLIDDDIADQPGLIALEQSLPRVPSVKKSVHELHALQNASRSQLDRSLSEDHHPSCSDIGSSCSSLASDDLMLDLDRSVERFGSELLDSPTSPVAKNMPFRSSATTSQHPEKRASWDGVKSEENFSAKRVTDSLASRLSSKPPIGRVDGRPRTSSLPLRPPRQVVLSECDDGGVKLDASSYRLVCQDLNGVKTLLLRLKRVLHEAETLNPFDQTNSKNFFYQALANNDLPLGFCASPTEETEQKQQDPSAITQENMDLKRQVVLLQQQLEERNRTINLLQHQMKKYMVLSDGPKEVSTQNAAVQTERPRLLQSLSQTSSSDESFKGHLISSKVKNAFDEQHESNSVIHAAFKSKLQDVSRSLSNINQALRLSGKRYAPLRSRSSCELGSS